MWFSDWVFCCNDVKTMEEENEKINDGFNGSLFCFYDEWRRCGCGKNDWQSNRKSCKKHDL